MTENGGYRVRVGDDGRIYSRHDNKADALAAAVELSMTGLGCAQILDNRGKLVRLRDGKITWADRSW